MPPAMKHLEIWNAKGEEEYEDYDAEILSHRGKRVVRLEKKLTTRKGEELRPDMQLYGK
jgi:hypothetical protein